MTTTTQTLTAFWRTVRQILCGDCIKHRGGDAILARMRGNGQLTCCRCGKQGAN